MNLDCSLDSCLRQQLSRVCHGVKVASTVIFVCWLLILRASAQIWHTPLSPNFVALTYEIILFFPNALFVLPIKIYTPRKQGLYVLFTTVIQVATLCQTQCRAKRETRLLLSGRCLLRERGHMQEELNCILWSYLPLYLPHLEAINELRKQEMAKNHKMKV